MLASTPASILNQKTPASGIPNSTESALSDHALNGGIQVRRPDRLKTARCNPTHFVQIRPAGAALVGKRHLGRRAAVFGLTAGDTTRRPIASSGRDRSRRRTRSLESGFHLPYFISRRARCNPLDRLISCSVSGATAWRSNHL